MSLDVRHLQMVQAIREEGTVTRAATRLHLTQSALSHQLLGIEEALGTMLFQRIGKQMVITPAGERLLAAATIVLEELRSAEHDISRQMIARDGILRVSTECYTCYHWLPAHIQAFNNQWPGVEVRIVVEATHQPLQALLEGKIDVGIVSGRWKNAKLSYTPLFRDELVVIVSPEHRLGLQDFVAAEDFKNEHLIAYSVPREQLTVFQEVLTPAGVTPRAVSHVPLTEAIIEMVKGGLGIAVIAGWAVAPQVEDGSVVALPLTAKGVHRQWFAATIRNRTTAEFVKSFLRQLKSETMAINRIGRSRRKPIKRGRKVPLVRSDRADYSV